MHGAINGYAAKSGPSCGCDEKADMRSAYQPKTSGTVTSLQIQSAVIQHKPLPKCYVIGGVSGSGKRSVQVLLLRS